MLLRFALTASPAMLKPNTVKRIFIQYIAEHNSWMFAMNLSKIKRDIIMVLME